MNLLLICQTRNSAKLHKRCDEINDEILHSQIKSNANSNNCYQRNVNIYANMHAFLCMLLCAIVVKFQI